ncbi:MAG: cell division protein ZapA [Pseudobdellovibrionaceae bacterium]
MSNLKDKTTYEFQIAGLPYKLKSLHDEATVQELVDYVDRKVKEALTVTKSGSFQSAAVLAALNIAEELILLKRKAQRELEILEEKTLKLSDSLENSKITRQGLNV